MPANAPALAALAACLVYVAVGDLRHRHIPNGAILVLLVLAVQRVVAAAEPGMVVGHLALAAAMFALCLAAYAADLMGGGDTKLLAVAILWIGPSSAVLFAVLLFGACLAVAMVMWAHALATGSPVRGQVMPFGLPIAAAWLATALMPANL